MRSAFQLRTAFALALGAASLLLLRRFPPERYPVYPPCPVHAFTGLQCPGCGATRALAALLHGEPAQALHWNALFTLGLPCALLYVLLSVWRPGLVARLPRRGLLATALLGTAAFTIWRNLPL